jgi:hypothetical protein
VTECQETGVLRARAVFVLLTVIVLVALCGCTSIDNTPQFTSPLSPTIGSNSPLPTPITTVNPPQIGKGTIIGILYDEPAVRPYAGQYIYLARVRQMDSASGGTPMFFAELDVKADPFGQTDATGRFVIENVEPGIYALTVWLPNLQQALLYDAKTNINLSVEIKPGQITNLGVMKIDGPR